MINAQQFSFLLYLVNIQDALSLAGRWRGGPKLNLWCPHHLALTCSHAEGENPKETKKNSQKKPQSEASYHQALAFGISASCWAKCSTWLYTSSPKCTAVVLQLEMEPGVVEQTAPARL